jgi:selenocysteine lyase/cysteine desulfurase
MQLDLDFIRAQFPAFQAPDLRDHAFFENAGGSYVCRHAIWRLSRFYRERKLQPYAPFAASEAGGAEMDEARRRMALLLGVQPDELVFGPSTTANVHVMAQAVRRWLRGEVAFGATPAIIVTNQDHEANSGAWRRLAEDGIEVREWQIDPDTGRLHAEDLKRLLKDERVRLVCLPHCSNILGEINDVAPLIWQIHRAGAYACVDGVSYAPHGIPDVQRLNADIYLFSAYKTFGPHQGLMVVRRRLADKLPNEGHDFNDGPASRKFAPAGPDHAQVAACAGIADYIDAVHERHSRAGRDATARAAFVHDLFREVEVRMLQPLLDFVSDDPRVRLLGPSDARRRAPTVSLVHARRGEDLARDLAKHGILCAGGDFYAPRPLKAMGVRPEHGVLRLSFLHYTPPEDIDRAIAALDRVL